MAERERYIDMKPVGLNNQFMNLPNSRGDKDQNNIENSKIQTIRRENIRFKNDIDDSQDLARFTMDNTESYEQQLK